MRRICRALLLCVALAALGSAALNAAPPGSAAELARVQGEERRIEQEFVDTVAGIVGVPPARIAALLPAGPRISDRARRLVQAIGTNVRVLSEAEQMEIHRADDERRRALAGLRQPAGR